MQALILAGGKGTRLRPLTVYTPKPVVPVCNRPFLLYQLDTLRRAGVTDVTLSLSYQPHKIEQQLGDGSDFGVSLSYTVEPQPMGTAGAYKFAEDLIREPTVVFNGDIVTDLDLKAAIREHDERGAVGDRRPRAGREPMRLRTGGGRRERVRHALSPRSRAPTSAASTPSTPARTSSTRRCSTSSPRARATPSSTASSQTCSRAARSSTRTSPQRAYWLDIGAPARYLQVHHDILAGRVARREARKTGAATRTSRRIAEIDELSLVADGCTVKPGAQIVNSVLGEGVHVEEKAQISQLGHLAAHARRRGRAGLGRGRRARLPHRPLGAGRRGLGARRQDQPHGLYADRGRALSHASAPLAPIRFGTDGWRAVIADEFTFANVERVAQAYAEFVRRQSAGASAEVVIGYDRRFLSGQFAARAAEVLAGNDIAVSLFDTDVPTPLVSWAVRERGAAGGVVITASHNPAHFNGFKIKAPWGGSAPPETTRAVEALVDASPPRRAALSEDARGRLEKETESYRAQVASYVDLERMRALDARIVVDPMHGTGGLWVENFLSGGSARRRDDSRGARPLLRLRQPRAD